MPNNYRIKEGMDVIGKDGKKIGDVAKVVVGESTREPRFFVIEKGLLFTKDYCVPREAINRVDQEGKVHVPLTKDEIERMPEYRGQPPTPEEARKAFETLGGRRSGESYEFSQMPFGMQGQAGGREQGRGETASRPYLVTEERYVVLPAEERERQGYRSEWNF